MFLVELVLQGVRGIRELARLRFLSGFNFVSAGNETGKSTVVDAMQRLLFPNNQTGLMETLVSRHASDASRAALVMFSDDGAYYRIIQDFSKRAVNLSQYNAASKEFSLLHKEWDNAAQFMAGLTTGMSEDDFATIFIFRRDHYAGQSGVSAPVLAPMPHARPSSPSALSGEKAAAAQSKLAELREVLKRSEEAADAEYRAQAAKLALDENKKKLTTVEELDRKKGEIESALAGLKGVEDLPEDLSDLIGAHERRQGQKMADAEDLNRSLEGLKMQLAGVPKANLIKDRLFIAGAALGVLSIFAGVSGFITTSSEHLFMISILLSLGLMVAGWYQGSRRNTQRKTVLKEVEALEQEIADLEKRFEQEGVSIRAWMQATGASTPGDLKEKADNYRYYRSLREDIQEQRQRILGDLTPDILQQEYTKQQQDLLELEQEAQAVAQYNVDTYGIRQDIERMEAASAPEASSVFNSEVQELPTEFAAPAIGSRRVGFQHELDIASRIGGIEMQTLVPAVESAAQRNLSAITGGRYVRIDVGHDGRPPVVHAKDGSEVRSEEISHGTRDLIYFCLRTGLVEALAGKRRLPFILDDPLAGLDPARQLAASQILRTLGTKTQVILFSSNPALKAEGDADAELR